VPNDVSSPVAGSVNVALAGATTTEPYRPSTPVSKPPKSLTSALPIFRESAKNR
jgi:hypothetical protein